MPRNRSVSPQKMPSNQSSEYSSGQLNSKEKDRLLKEIQDMFTGTVDPEVVHLVLTECEWRVDEAIETMFSMVPVEGKSEEEDLQMIACALIGDVEDDHLTKKSVSKTTAKKSTLQKSRDKDVQKSGDKDMTPSTVTSVSSFQTQCSDKNMHEKESSYRLPDSQQMSGECVDNIYDSFQSYMAMSKIYGGYTPEMIGAMTLGDETMTKNTGDSSNLTSTSSVSGITDINLSDKLNIVTNCDTADNAGGKMDTCCPDQAYVMDFVDLHEREDLGQPEMSTNFEKSEILKDDVITLGSHCEISAKGDNSDDDSSTDTDFGQGVEEDCIRIENNAEMCPGVSAMFSAFKSVQDKLKDSSDKFSSVKQPDVDKISPQFNLDAPAFVPQFTAPPPYRPPPPGYDFNAWSNQPPGAQPMFFIPKGPMQRQRGPSGPRPRFEHFFHPRFRPRLDPPNGQPRPLQPLFAVRPGGQFKGGNAGLQTGQPVSWPEEVAESFPTQTGQFSGMSYSEKASKEPKLIPDWAKRVADDEQNVTMETDTFCSEQVKKVKSYLDKGRLLMVLMRGMPGSGKSFLARKIVFDGVVLSTDDYFYRCGDYNYKQDLLTEAHTWNKARARNAMDEKINPVIIDNTNTMEWEMLPYVRLAIARGYEIQLMEPDTPWRFQPKILCKKNSHGVSKDVIRKMNQRYQHNVSVSSMIAAANKQRMFDARRGKEQEPVKEADHNSNIKLVEYEASSDEDLGERSDLRKTGVNQKTHVPRKTQSCKPVESKAQPLAPLQTLLRQERKDSGGTYGSKKPPPPIQPFLSLMKHVKVEAQGNSDKNGKTNNKSKSSKKNISHPPLPIQTSLCQVPQVIPKFVKLEKAVRLQSSNSGNDNSSNGGSSNSSNSKTNNNSGSSNSSNNSNTIKSRNSSSSSNNSVPSSPRKRKRKKRRPSSSKSEVIQAIEEILNCCEEGEITPVDLKAREEEIEALLFMSHVSEDDKKEIELWFKERLESLKNKGKDQNRDGNKIGEEKRNTNDNIEHKDSEMAKGDDGIPLGMKMDMKEVFQRTSKENFDENLISELDNIVSSDFSKILEFAKSAFTQECGNLAEEDISDVLEEISKLKQTKETEVSKEDRGEEDEDDPWLQGRPKPRRSRRRRISQGDRDDCEETNSEDHTWEIEDRSKEQEMDVEKLEADYRHESVTRIQAKKADGHLEKELVYWNRPFNADMNKLSSDVTMQEVITEEKQEITCWEDPKPQRERIDSDRSNSSRSENELKSGCEAHSLKEETETVSSVSVFETENFRNDDSEQLCESVLVVDSDGFKTMISEQLLESEDIVVAKTVEAINSMTAVKNTTDFCSSHDQVQETLEGDDSAQIGDDLKDEFNFEGANKDLDDEEEFRSCGSDSESEEKLNPTVNDDFKQNPEDSFKSVGSSKGGSNDSENLSFLSDVADESVEKFKVESITIEPVTDNKFEEKDSSQKDLSDQLKAQSDKVVNLPDENETSFETTNLTSKNEEVEVPDSDSGATNSESLGSESDSEKIKSVPLSKFSDYDLTHKSNLQDSSPQKSSTPKKPKSSNRVRPGGNHVPFLGDDVKQKFQSENWSSYGKLANENSNIDASKFVPDKQNKPKRDTRRSYSFTSARDFSLLEELNRGTPRAKITGLDKYTVLLGKIRDINLEESLRLKTRSGCDESVKDMSKCSVMMLDKGSMTDEDDFQPQGDVDFLASSFPGADISHLRETLAMCQGNVEWTLNLLLDWGVSQPFSSVEKEEICKEMKLKTVTSPDRTLKTPELESLRNPLSLFDICRDHIEANNLADIDELQEKLIKASKLRLDRMESHSYERVHSISVSESSFSIDNDSILSELTSRSALSSDIYISPEKVVSDNSDPSAQSKGGQLFHPGPADQKGDWTLEDSWTEEEKSMVDGDAHVMLPVPIELVRDLEELFGPVQSSLSDCEEFEVSLDLRTAKRLFANLRRKPESRRALERKRREEELALQKQLKDDEAFARRLQEEEDSNQRSQNSRQEVVNPSQLLREAKAAALNAPNLAVHHTTSGAGLSVINVRRKRGMVNLMDIMEEERTNQQRREEKIRRMEGDRVAISTRLKRQKLTNQFPGMDENFLEEIFEANGYNLEDTVCVLQEAVGRGVSPRTRKLELSTPEREIKSSQEEPISRRNLQDLIEDSWQSQGAGARYQSWEETGVPEYEDIRGEANIHHRLRNECFQKAQEAFRRGMKDVASFYSQQGHLHTVKLKEANKRASEKILEQRSAVLLQQGTLDLHGFHVEEAINILNSVIQQREDEFQARPDRRKQSLFVITGRGRHSKGGVAKLRPAIINHLNNTGYRYVEQPTGMFKIQLHYRA